MTEFSYLLPKFYLEVVAAILHRRLTTAILYHDTLHSFRAGRGTGTATLEAKLLHQIAAMREEVLYMIFLDLTKAYDTLDRSRSLEILEGYRVGILLPPPSWYARTPPPTDFLPLGTACRSY